MVWADAAAPIAISGGTDLPRTGEGFYSGWADVLLKWCEQQGAVLGLCISFVLGSQWVHCCCLVTASFVGMIKGKFRVSPPCLRPPEGPYWCDNSPGWDLWGYLRHSFPKHPFGHSEQLTTHGWFGWASWPWFPSTGSPWPSLEVQWGSPAALQLQNQGWAPGRAGAFCSPFPRAPPLLLGLHKPCVSACDFSLCQFILECHQNVAPSLLRNPGPSLSLPLQP